MLTRIDHNILQAANTIQLFTFIKKDLGTHHPQSDSGSSFQDATSSFDPIAEPHFPKSLYLIRPLFTTYELNPVASTAQASVPIPEGLDLDAWIVPSQQDHVVDEDEDADDVVRKSKKSKKGKGKETNGTRVKSGKRRKRDEEPKR
jgi:AP-3 complex subunit delta-1